MPVNAYTKQWHEAQQALSDMLVYEVPPDEQKPEKDRIAAFQLLATMYVKYIQILRKLEQCYDQIVQPQKRRVLRVILDGVIGRVLELKHEMVNLEFSEYHYFDDVLSDLKLTPNDVEIPIPKYFVKEREKILKEREILMGETIARQAKEAIDESQVKMQADEAIQLIQVHERARQGRLRSKLMREIRKQEEKDRQAANRGQPTLSQADAAIRIQKAVPPMKGLAKSENQMQALKAEAGRRLVQAMHEQEYQKALETVKDKIRETEGPDMKEAMQDQIRQWFLECRDATGKFPEYPDEDAGGSATIFKEKSPEELERELKEKEEAGGKGGKGKKGGKKSGKKGNEKGGKKGGKDSKGKKGKGDDDDEGWKMTESKFVPNVKEGTHSYEAIWKHRDESDNFAQKHDVELIKEEKRMEVEQEIRIQVDELMRQELRNLKIAVDKEKIKKGRSGKKKKGKKKKSGKKGKRGKREKDLTPDRTIESLYAEMVERGVIQKVEKVTLSDYEGEYCFLGTTLRQSNIEPQPSLSDVRRLVTEFSILPLGSSEVHEKAPLVKSLLLTGPAGVGKKMLVHAICNETGANLINLTATNIVGRYPGKDGLKMLLHLVFKVGRLLQPTVIFIDDCEKMFKKKIPKTDLYRRTESGFMYDATSDPKRLKKELPKLIKGVKPEDRIMLIGASSAPFEAELKPFCSLYQKVILIPRPDYASRNLLWRKMILKYGGVITSQLDVSSLSKISDGYTMGHMVACCKQVLTDRRIAQLAKRPLLANEFVGPLARLDPIYTDEENAFKDWYKKTPLGRKRARAEAAELEAAQGGGKGKGKGKAGAKGGKKGKKKK